jgi:AcrR family transcriptional regulator
MRKMVKLPEMPNTTSTSDPQARAAPGARRPQPRQSRSLATIARILDSASALLEQVGFERLNTNLICEHAGLTPPALYRHFANKYAVMEELGRRLMDAQDDALFEFLKEQPAVLLTPAAIATLLRGQHAMACAQPGGRWIMRSLHSTPALVSVRLQSHQRIASHLIARHLEMEPSAQADDLARRYRIAVDAGAAIVELLLDQPELDIDAVTEDAAEMIAGFLAGR